MSAFDSRLVDGSMPSRLMAFVSTLEMCYFSISLLYAHCQGRSDG